jgi:ABC-2 type transport system ATP-binding protein
MLAADSPDQLQSRFRGDHQIVAEIAAPYADLNQCWRDMDCVEQFDVSPAEGEFFRCAITARAGVDLRPLIFDTARARGWKLRELTRSRHSLEDIFVQVIRADEEEKF